MRETIYAVQRYGQGESRVHVAARALLDVQQIGVGGVDRIVDCACSEWYVLSTPRTTLTFKYLATTGLTFYGGRYKRSTARLMKYPAAQKSECRETRAKPGNQRVSNHNIGVRLCVQI